MFKIQVSKITFTKLSFLTAFLSVLILLGNSSKMYADSVVNSSVCRNGFAYSGSLPVEPDSYDVYLKLGRTQQKKPASIYVGINESTCIKLGSVKVARGDRWVRVGGFNTSKNITPTFTLDSLAIDSLPDANRPQILLTSKTNPICKPSDECRFKFQGNSAYIQPVGTVLNEDSLQVLKVVDPDQDTVDYVEYYTDSDFAYRTDTLESFNERYAPIGRHNIYRVIKYQSGQKVVLPSNMNQDIGSGFKNFVFGYTLRSKSALQILMLISLATALCMIAVYILRKIYQKTAWKMGHNASAINSRNMKLRDKTGKFLNWSSKFRRYLPIAISVFLLLLCINLFNNHGLRIVTVSGESMKNTLQDKDRMVVNKFNKWWASFNGQEYIPKRGSVVVIREAENAFVNKQAPGFVVKRIIGLPGERVVVKDHRVKIYSKNKSGSFDPDKGQPWEETMVYKPSILPTSIDITLGRSELFVMGDNRPGSTDSRSYGPVQVSDVYGKVIARLSPNFKTIGL